MSKLPFKKDAWIRLAIAHGAYWAKDDGTIWKRQPGSLIGRQILACVHKKTGRHYFNMTFLGVTKSVLVNRFIGWALIPNPLLLPEVNHLDGDKGNNRKTNLEWSTRSANEKHAFATGLKDIRGAKNPNSKHRRAA